MSITVRPATPSFFAEISSTSRSLQAADRDAIDEAINRYAVVVFRGQTLSDTQQIDFAARFGPINPPGQRARHTGIKHRLERPELADISNLDGDGKVLDVNAKRRLDWLANRLWHTDASFRAIPGALSLLYAHVIPDEGGDTRIRRHARRLCRAAQGNPGAARGADRQELASFWTVRYRSYLGSRLLAASS